MVIRYEYRKEVYGQHSYGLGRVDALQRGSLDERRSPYAVCLLERKNLV